MIDSASAWPQRRSGRLDAPHDRTLALTRVTAGASHDQRQADAALNHALERLAAVVGGQSGADVQHVIQTRKDCPLRMVKGPLASESALATGLDDPKVGTTRWQCPALGVQARRVI